MNIIIKRAKSNNLKEIQELNNKLFEKEFKEYDDSLKVGWSFEEKGEDYFKDMLNNNFVIVAYDDENIIGYLAGSINIKNSYNTTKIAELDNMFVEENYRRCGVGKKLIQNFIEYCDENKMDEIRVTASFKNKDAIQFYIKNGFKEFELTLQRRKKHEEN